jgi:hypothetical protein
MNPDDETVPEYGSNENPNMDTDTEYDGLLFGKFDKEKFLNFFISGIVSAIVGIIIISNTKNTPAHVLEFKVSESIHFISDILPKSPKDLILFVLGNILLLVGVYCIFLALKIVVRYIAGKTRGY